MEYNNLNNINKKFLNEIKERSASFKSGNAKSYTWEEVKKAARKSLKGQ